VEAIAQVAVGAAREDPRFPPVIESELAEIAVEVTVLTPPVAITGPLDERLSQIEPGRHGLIVRGRGRNGLLLPQVCTDYHWDARTFLDQTCIKAGLPPHLWQSKSVEVIRFEGQIFSEHREGFIPPSRKVKGNRLT
jgi:uncharacterized protein (TIGR00296 family)